MPALKLSKSFWVDENGLCHSMLTRNDKKVWPLLDLDDRINLCNLSLQSHPNCEWAGSRDACVIGMLGAYGRRDEEIAGVRLNDCTVDDKNLTVNFRVLKEHKNWRQQCGVEGCKKRYSSNAKNCIEHGPTLIPIKDYQPLQYDYRAKPRSVLHPIVKNYILPWLDYARSLSKGNTFLFPTIRNYEHAEFATGSMSNVDPRDSTYPRDWAGLRMTRQNVTVGVAYPLVERYAGTYAQRHPKYPGRLHLWGHLWRHSLATELKVKEHFTDEMLMDWFDWKQKSTAQNYTDLVGNETEEKTAALITV